MTKIRELHKSDLSEWIRLMHRLDEQTEYLLYEQGERPDAPAFWLDRIESLWQDGGTVFIADQGGSTGLIGYLEVRRPAQKKIRHRIFLVIGLLEEYSGMGIGTRLMQHMEQWAIQEGVRRATLTLIAENRAALALYEKMEYRLEGIHPASMRISGRFVDELTMGKWLDEHPGNP